MGGAVWAEAGTHVTRASKAAHRAGARMNEPAVVSIRRQELSHRSPGQVKASEGVRRRHVDWDPREETMICTSLYVVATRPRSRRIGRCTQAIERESLIAHALLANQIGGAEFEEPRAETLLNRILDVAPEVPVEVEAAG